MKKHAVVIDTNVIVKSNEMNGKQCSSACIARLKQIRINSLICLDSRQRILTEYRKNVNFSGQPGAGDAFLKWLWDNQEVVEHCEKVEITPTPSDPENFIEFPQVDELKKFDRSDRKFVAVTKKSNYHPPILVASDRGWKRHEADLRDNGVSVDFLC